MPYVTLLMMDGTQLCVLDVSGTESVVSWVAGGQYVICGHIRPIIALTEAYGIWNGN